MRTIQSAEAKTHFSQLLDEVERGETIVITRHGRPIARLVAEPASRGADVLAAIEEIRAARKGKGPMTVEEIIAARDEGRRF
jgi:prevent-host-death family protein